MTTTKFILLATTVIAGTAAYILTRKRNNLTAEVPQQKKNRHLNPLFSKMRRQVLTPGKHMN